MERVSVNCLVNLFAFPPTAMLLLSGFSLKCARKFGLLFGLLFLLLVLIGWM